MTIFHVKDMTCQHCVKTITSSVLSVAPGATVLCDVAAHTVTISGPHAEKNVEQALIDSGYTPLRK